MKRQFLLRCIFGVLLITCVTQAVAEIHKWQDENGRWHFSDSPKDKEGIGKKVFGGDADQIVNKKTPAEGVSSEEPLMNAKTSAKTDLKAQLEQKYTSGSLIQDVTFSVVGVETAMGTGSGFFVTGDGYLVTNRHVVRPTSTPEWEKNKTLFEQETQKLEQWRDSLDQEEQSLDDYAVELERYRRGLEAGNPNKLRSGIDWEEYRDYESRYEKRRTAFGQAQRDYEIQVEEHQQRSDEFNFKSSLAGVSRSFKVFLKDNTELSASLVSISTEHDLALLKLDDYQTPTLKLYSDEKVTQGQTVFAIGSPLGMRDSVTKGIVAKLENDYIITDAQIQPGNSGGPLVNESGEVIGVNTMKFHSGNVLAQGFGMAIPVTVVKQEFANWVVK